MNFSKDCFKCLENWIRKGSLFASFFFFFHGEGRFGRETNKWVTAWKCPWWLRWSRIYLQNGRPGFDPWVGKIPWRRAWQPTPVFLPGESPWSEEPGGLQSIESQRVGQDWATKHSTVLESMVGLSYSQIRYLGQIHINGESLNLLKLTEIRDLEIMNWKKKFLASESASKVFFPELS